MPEGIYFVRLKDGIIVYANAKFEKIFGYNAGEMIGKHASIVNAPTTKKPKETAREIMNIMKKTGEWLGEINNIKKDGTSFWCYASCFLFDHPEHGKIIVAMHTDITKRKQAEESLKIKNFIFDHSFSANSISNANAIVTEVNQSFLDNWGFLDKKEIVGKSFSVCFNDPKEAMIAHNALDKNGKWSGEFVAKRKDGSTFIAYGPATKLIDEKGKLIGYQSTLFDITERKKAKETIILDEEKFEEIFNYSPIAIELYNAKGELEKVNKATLQMFGVKNEKEIVDFKLFDDPNVPDSAKKVLKNGNLVEYENVFDFEKVQKFNLYNTIKSGIIHLSTVITPLKKGSSGYLAMIEDATDSKNSQIKLREKLDEMEKMNKLMVGRELKMIELKDKIDKLTKK